MSESIETIETANIRRRAEADALPALAAVPAAAWDALAACACEPNAYALPRWMRGVDADGDARVLAAWSGARLIAAMPVIPLWRAMRMPLPALAAFDPFHSLTTPLLAEADAERAAAALLAQARDAGAHALVLRTATLDGPAALALEAAARGCGGAAHRIGGYRRAALDARQPAEAVLAALGPRRLKELRRQRRRLGDLGAVSFNVARDPDAAVQAYDAFLALEAQGWKGRRGTALSQERAVANALRSAVAAMAARGECEVATLSAGTRAVASGIVLRHARRAFFFKIAIDEGVAALSPGVQLTLDLTRHLCGDPGIDGADSTAAADHPMIDRIWRDRLAVGDLVIALRRGDPAAAAVVAALRGRAWLRSRLRG